MVFGGRNRGWQLVILVLWLTSAYGKATKDDEREIVRECYGKRWNVSQEEYGDTNVWYALKLGQTRAEREFDCDRLRSS